MSWLSSWVDKVLTGKPPQEAAYDVLLNAALRKLSPATKSQIRAKCTKAIAALDSGKTQEARDFLLMVKLILEE
jgi:hypothetical protein